MKKRILFILGRYFPNASPNSICAQNVMDCLPEDEYEIEIICYDDGTEYDGRYHVTKISRGILLSEMYKRENNEKIGKFLNTIYKLRNSFFIPVWPWIDPVFTVKLYKTAKKIYEKKPFEYVVSVHMPLSSVIVGDLLKKKYPSITHVPYFLDSLSGGVPLSHFSKEWYIKKTIKWEKRLLPSCDKIVMMESSRPHHLKYSKKYDYFSKFIFLDIPLLKFKKTVEVVNPFNEDAEKFINVTFCGTANYPLRDLYYFSQLAQCVSQIDKNIRFHIIGPCNCINVLKGENIFVYGVMEHDKLIPYMTYSDVLLNFGVTTPSAISGKIFEYMSYKKPIISTYSIDDEACIPYLKEYPKALLIDERNDDYCSQAREVVRFIYSSMNFMIQEDEIKNIFKENMPETFVENIFESKGKGQDDKKGLQ